MKKSITKTTIFITMLLFASFVNAQNSPTDALFEKYGSKDGFTTVQINKELFTMFAEISKESTEAEIKEMEEVLNKLEYIRVLMYETEKNKSQTFTQFKSELDGIKLQGFTELMIVKETGKEFRFMVRKTSSGRISELLMIMKGPESGFVSITGDIDMKSIAKISKSMNVKGLENLQKIK